MRSKDKNERKLDAEVVSLRRRVAELEGQLGSAQKAENALLESEEHYRTLVESAGEAIASVTEEGIFTFMNATAARRLGGSPGSLVGKTMWELFPPEMADRQMSSIRNVIHTGKGNSVIGVSQVQGQNRWYNTTMEPLRNSRGMITAVLVIARDIHELKQAQDQLEEYRQKMSRAEQLASLGVLNATLARRFSLLCRPIRDSCFGEGIASGT